MMTDRGSGEIRVKFTKFTISAVFLQREPRLFVARERTPRRNLQVSASAARLAAALRKLNYPKSRRRSWTDTGT
jgi:hypothetical protein